MTSLLLPNCLAVPVYVADEIVGRSVFQNFVQEEFEEEGVPDEFIQEFPNELLEEEVSEAEIDDENFNIALEHVRQHTEGESGPEIHAAIIKVGAAIRELANEFAQSRERRCLKDEVDKVDVQSITEEAFFAMLEEVFKHGIKREGLIAVFFFCADVVIKCIKLEMKDIGFKLFKWAIRYIVKRVCAWVADHGGWENVIRNTLSKRQIAVIGAAAVGIVAVGGFFYYKYSA